VILERAKHQAHPAFIDKLRKALKEALTTL
jgi:hypothetical protein